MSTFYASGNQAFQFAHLDTEIGLADSLFAKTGRDLFKGVTEPADRKAAARIAIVMNDLEAEFGGAYEKIYGEPLPEKRRINPPKGKSKC